MAVFAMTFTSAAEKLLWERSVRPGPFLDSELNRVMNVPLFNTNWGTLTGVQLITELGADHYAVYRNNTKNPVSFTLKHDFFLAFTDLPAPWLTPGIDVTQNYIFEWPITLGKKGSATEIDGMNYGGGWHNNYSVPVTDWNSFVGKGVQRGHWYANMLREPLPVGVVKPAGSQVGMFPIVHIRVDYDFIPTNPTREKYGKMTLFTDEWEQIYPPVPVVPEDDDGDED